MRCTDFERRLQDLLDENPQGFEGIEPLHGTLAQHAADCCNCRQLVSGYRLMLAGLASLACTQPSTQLVERVVASTVRSSSSKWRGAFKTWGSTFATAASILIILSVVALNREHQSQLRPEISLVPAAAESIATTTTTTTQSTLGESNTGRLTETLVNYPRRLDLDQASVEMVLNLAGFRPVTFSAEVLGSHWNQQPAWMVEVADGLRPMTESMSGTLNALRRVIPESAPAEAPNQGARHNRYCRYDRIV